MNYKKIYDQLVEKCRVRGLDKSALEGYYEKHHIVPRCMGGSDDSDNFVLFTAKEHYIAHLLLTKVYPDSHGLYYAAFMMGSNGRNSKLYSNLREFVASTNSKRNKGRLKTDYTGTRVGRLLVIRYILDFEASAVRKSKWECICDCGNTTYIATQYLSDGRIQSCGCLLSETSRDKMLGKEKAATVRDKISRTLKSKNLKPWENYKIDAKGKNKWLKADEIFDLWVENSMPKSKSMTNIYNQLMSTSYPRSYFKTIVRYFEEGWVPVDDEAWLTFRAKSLLDNLTND